jgi:hypothetical protein
MEVSQDIQLLQDLENNIVSQFSEMAPKMVTRRGWLV